MVSRPGPPGLEGLSQGFERRCIGNSAGPLDHGDLRNGERGQQAFRRLAAGQRCIATTAMQVDHVARLGAVGRKAVKFHVAPFKAELVSQMLGPEINQMIAPIAGRPDEKKTPIGQRLKQRLQGLPMG